MGNAIQKATEKHVKETDSTALMELEWKVSGGVVRWATPAPKLDLAPFCKSCPARAGLTAREGRPRIGAGAEQSPGHSSPWDKRAGVPRTLHLLPSSVNAPDALPSTLFPSSTCSQDNLFPSLASPGLQVQLCHQLLV